MTRRCWQTIVLSVCATMAAGPLYAQRTSPHPFEDLGRYLTTGDRVTVVDREAGAMTGTVDAIAQDSVTLLVGGRPRVVPRAAIGWVERPGDRWWDGVLIGGTVGTAIFAAVAGDIGCSGGNCADDYVWATAFGFLFGGGIGLAYDLSSVRHPLLYGTAPPSRHVGSVSRADRFDDVWLRLRPEDPIEVVLASGARRRVRFVRATGTELVVRDDDTSVEWAAADIARVTRRGTFTRQGQLGIGTLTFLLTALGSDGNGGERFIGGAITGVLSGLTWGSLVGAIAPRRDTVYEAVARPAAEIRLQPILGHGRRGVAVAIRFAH
jgi:preprotein translocase subunit YajC